MERPDRPGQVERLAPNVWVKALFQSREKAFKHWLTLEKRIQGRRPLVLQVRDRRETFLCLHCSGYKAGRVSAPSCDYDLRENHAE